MMMMMMHGGPRVRPPQKGRKKFCGWN